MPWYDYSASPQSDMKPYVEVRIWHGRRSLRLVALVDSGADASLLNVEYAYALGLVRADAAERLATTASGDHMTVLTWPNANLELQFERDRFPFAGAFVEFPSSADPENLVGRADFFRRYIVQFWDQNEMFNIDASPDFPRPGPTR